MNLLPACLRRPAAPPPVRRPAPAVDLLLPDDDTGAPAGCGWFDSSQALRDGLAVQELPPSDLPVLALWFGALADAPVPAASARLQ